MTICRWATIDGALWARSGVAIIAGGRGRSRRHAGSGVARFADPLSRVLALQRAPQPAVAPDHEEQADCRDRNEDHEAKEDYCPNRVARVDADLVKCEERCCIVGA